MATDTIKTTVNVLAQQPLGQSIEPFAPFLAEHFLKKHPQVNLVTQANLSMAAVTAIEDQVPLSANLPGLLGCAEAVGEDD